MAKEKLVNFELIDNKTSEPYRIMNKAMKYHKELDGAVIAMAWRTNLKHDKDGHLVLGKCIKVSDLYKEFAEYDFIILLNREVWEDSEFTEKQKLALVDHELCHCAPDKDKEGYQKADERGRKLWRTRTHDIEEFQAIVHRHGCYKKDLEVFAESLIKKRRTPLFNEETRPEAIQ